jgi:hypothetical protein
VVVVVGGAYLNARSQADDAFVGSLNIVAGVVEAASDLIGNTGVIVRGVVPIVVVWTRTSKTRDDRTVDVNAVRRGLIRRHGVFQVASGCCSVRDPSYGDTRRLVTIGIEGASIQAGLERLRGIGEIAVDVADKMIHIAFEFVDSLIGRSVC